VKALAGKQQVKAALQGEVGLPGRPNVPLFGTITRLAEQKGVDLLVPALDEMLAQNEMQFVFLGSGEQRYERALHNLEKKHPGKVAIRIGYNHALSHRIEAACDFYLMPSRFEPCGLNQLYSLRYGTIPVVRAVGGLDDSVVDAQESAQQATGIKFAEYSPAALAHAIRKALALYAAPAAFERFRLNAMAADFSWDQTAKRYLELYSAGR
jgi:starch synthase